MQSTSLTIFVAPRLDAMESSRYRIRGLPNSDSWGLPNAHAPLTTHVPNPFAGHFVLFSSHGIQSPGRRLVRLLAVVIHRGCHMTVHLANHFPALNNYFVSYPSGLLYGGTVSRLKSSLILTGRLNDIGALALLHSPLLFYIDDRAIACSLRTCYCTVLPCTPESVLRVRIDHTV